MRKLITILIAVTILAVCHSSYGQDSTRAQISGVAEASPAKSAYFNLWSEVKAITPQNLPPGEVRPGSPLTYIIRFSNIGTDTIENLKVINYAPNRLFASGWYTKYVQDTIVFPPGPRPNTSKSLKDIVTVYGETLLDSIAWEFDVIPPSPDTFTVQLKLQVADSIYSSLTLTNFVRFLYPPFPDQKSVDVALRLEPKIEFFKLVNPNVLYPGEMGTFTIRYRNVGDRPSDKESIEDILPIGVEFMNFLPGSHGQGATQRNVNPNDPDTLLWSDPFIPNNGELRRVEFMFRVSNDPVLQPAKYITNIATRFAGGVPLDTAQAKLAVLGLPDMVSELQSVNGNLIYSPGAPIPLQGKIKNLGGPNPTTPSFAVSFYAVDLNQSPPTTIPIVTFQVSLPDSSSSMIVPNTGPYAWIPPVAQAGSSTYMICMKVDADSIVTEFDETNNVSCDTIRVGISALRVIVDRVTAYDTAGFRGYLPKFPYPIFSYISIADQNDFPVRGLADSLKFIGRGDTTDSGALLDSIWMPLLEYHQENRSLPAQPNIYSTFPQFELTEVTASSSEGISVALVLDESGSMSGSFQEARAAVKIFIGRMSPQDQAAVIKFGSQVVVKQPLTNDTNALINAIDSEFLGGGTALYDAIYQGVALVTKASGRKAVLVYTDGVDGASNLSLEEAIAYARAEGVPVYTLGFGGANRALLQQIADQTGGLFQYVEDASQGGSFYAFLSRLWKSYYILAHASTDPAPDGTWRVVDVSVNYLGFTASDTGLYRAPLANLDLFVTQQSFPELVQDGRKFVKAGEIVPFTISYGNLGAIGGAQVEIIMQLHPLLIAPTDSVDFDPRPPDVNTNGRLVWRIDNVAAQQSGAIGFKATVNRANYPPLETMLIDSVSIRSANPGFETNLANNLALDTLYTLAAQPEYDLRLRFLGNSICTIGPNASEIYQLEVENDSTFRVDNVVVELNIGGDMPSGSYEIFDVRDNFTQLTPMRWQLESLLPGQKDTLSFKVEYGGFEASDWGKRASFVAQVDTLPNGQRDQNPLDNIARWECLAEFPIALVLDAFPPNDKQTKFDVLEKYRLIVKNNSPVSVRDLTLHLKLDPLNAATPPQQIDLANVSGLDTSWVIPLLPPNGTDTTTVEAKILPASPPGIYGFKMTAWVDTLLGESDVTDNRREWNTTVNHDPKYDVRLTFLGDSAKTVCVNTQKRYVLEITNLSTERVDSVRLVLDIDDNLIDDCYTIIDGGGASISSNEHLEWRIALDAAATVPLAITILYDKIKYADLQKSIKFAAKVDTVFRQLKDQNPADNITNWVRTKECSIDLALDSTPENKRTLTRFGELKPYQLTVRNSSDLDLSNLILHLELRAHNAATDPNKIAIVGVSGRKTSWTIDSLASQDSVTYPFEVSFDSHDDPGIYGFDIVAWVDTLAGEKDSTDNRREWTTTVNYDPKFDLRLTFLGDSAKSVCANTEERYEFEITNLSTERVDSLLLELTIDDDASPGDLCYTIIDSGRAGIGPNGQLQWRIGPLDSGAKVQRAIVISYGGIKYINLGQSIKFVAEVDTAFRKLPDQNLADNTVRWERIKECPIDLVLDEPTPGNERPQANFDVPQQYSFIVRNASAVRLPPTMLHVKLEARPGTHRKYIKIDSLLTSWQIRSLAPNDTAARNLTVTILTPDDSGTYGFTMVAWVDTLAHERERSNNRREWQTTASAAAKLRMTPIDLAPTQFSYAQVLNYSFRYKNEGNFIARDVTLTVKIPEATTYVEGWATGANGQVKLMPNESAALGDLPPDSRGTATVRLRVFDLEDVLDKYRGQTSVKLVFEAKLRSQNADSVSQSRTDVLEIRPLAEAFYLSHNLFRPGQDNAVELYIDVTENTAVRFKIYNLAGELMRSFSPQQVRIGGRVSALWDGRNDRGDYVGSGLYIVFAEVDYKRERPSRRLVVVR